MISHMSKDFSPINIPTLISPSHCYISTVNLAGPLAPTHFEETYGCVHNPHEGENLACLCF